MRTTRSWNLRGCTAALAVFSATSLWASAAQAILKIGAAATANMSCANGVCEPTARDAVLNVGDLENLLASGNVTVTTTGSGVETDDMHVNAAFAWSNSSTLALQAHRSIEINAAVSIAGPSGLTLDSGSKGALSFGRLGNFTFTNLSSSLVIEDASYTLVSDIKTLAGDIADDSGGNFALANNYDASGDGTYYYSPISTVFKGTFEGLGNAISNLAIDGGTKIKAHEAHEAFFLETSPKARLRDLGLTNVDIHIPLRNHDGSRNAGGAGLVAYNEGVIESCYSTGKVAASRNAEAAGLVEANFGTIANSYSTASIEGTLFSVGGLVADNFATISGSYATGSVYAPSAGGLIGVEVGGIVTGSYATGTVTLRLFKHSGGGWGGGLIGYLGYGSRYAAGAISNSYATGNVKGTPNSYVGGLLGWNGTANSTISSSYSTGAVTVGAGGTVGGLIGVDDAELNADTYWDTDTSGITNLSQGAGNVANDPGISGLTTAQFQSGLPAGFDPAVWAENANINGGLPYLRANKPH